MTASASESLSRPPRISGLAACTSERATASCQRRADRCGRRPASGRARSAARAGRASAGVAGGAPRPRAAPCSVASRPWNCASCRQVARSTRASASTGSPRSGSAPRIASTTWCDRVLHDGVEQCLAGREVDVDRRPHDAGPASDLGHAGVGIARQCFERGVEDRGDAAFGVGTAALRGGRCRCRRRSPSQWIGIAVGFSRSFGTKWRARGRTVRATRLRQ